MLGSAELCGVSSDLQLDEHVRRGFREDVIVALSRFGLTVDELAKLTVTSRRTINRFLGATAPLRLNVSVSERMLRVATVLALGEELLGSHDRLLNWMRAPNRYLGDKTPMYALETEFGRNRVVQSMYVIVYGGVA